MAKGGRVGPDSAALLFTKSRYPGLDPSAGIDIWSSLSGRLADSQPSSVDVWEAVEDRSDLASWRPQLLGDTEIVPLTWARTGPRALISRGADVYQLMAGEAELASLMDGRHTLSDLVARRFDDSGDLELSSVADLAEMLRLAGFLADRPQSVDAALDRALDVRPKWRRSLRQATRTLSVEWDGADRVVRWCYRHALRWVMNRWGALASVAVVVGGLVALGLVLSSHRYHLITLSAGWGFALFLTLNALIILIHEMGHATAVVHRGRKLTGAGVRLYYGTPAFFVNAPQALLLPRRERIMQAAAGPWFEAVAGAIASWVLFLSPSGTLSEVLYRFVVINYLVLALNLVPLLELDGYMIVADSIGVPDLRARALAFYRRDLWHKLANRQGLTRADLGLAAYAVAGLAFAGLCLFLAVSFWRGTFGGVISRMWHAGPLGVVLLFILVLVLVGPLLQVVTESLVGVARQGVQVWHRVQFRLQRRWRVEAAHTVDRLEAFDDLPVAVLNDLAGRVRLVTVAPLQTLVRQGEPADAYYVVRRGRVDVVEELPDGRRRTLKELGAGEAFGELALVRRSPRSASVVALERAELFVVDVGSFDRLLAAHLRIRDFAPTVQQAAELAEVPAMRSLDLQELVGLVEAGDWLTVGPGQDLVVQGDPPDGFYLLLEGRAEVLVDGRPTRVLERGSHFGEIALMGAGRRTATVRAITPVRTFRVSVEGFASVLGKLFMSSLTERAPVAQDRRS